MADSMEHSVKEVDASAKRWAQGLENLVMLLLSLVLEFACGIHPTVCSPFRRALHSLFLVASLSLLNVRVLHHN